MCGAALQARLKKANFKRDYKAYGRGSAKTGFAVIPGDPERRAANLDKMRTIQKRTSAAIMLSRDASKRYVAPANTPSTSTAVLDLAPASPRRTAVLNPEPMSS